MANEIIKLIDYILGNPFFQGMVITYAIIGVIVATMVIAIFYSYFSYFLKNIQQRIHERKINK